MNRYFRCAALVLTLAACVISPVLAGGKGRQSDDKTGRIDWNKGVIYATGLGAVPQNETNDAKAYLKARSFARMDARRNLLAIVDHVRIDSQTVGQDYEAVSDTVREQISGLVKGTEVFAEREIKKGNGTMVEVTVTMPLYGQDGLTGVLLPELAKRNSRLPEPTERTEEDGALLPTLKPDDVPPAVEAVPESSRAEDAYTSVVIDVRGLGVERSMSPKIRRRDGSEVWGTVRVSDDFVIENGIASYVHSLSEARRSTRAGSNPLVIKAASKTGRRFTTDAVISDDDADVLLSADRQSRFLDKFHVIFIVDEGK